MKKLLATLMISALFLSTFAQFSKEVPNYIRAKNSNYIVNFLTMTDMGVKSHYTSVSIIPQKRKISPDEHASLEDALFDTICKLSNNWLQKLKMPPVGFVNMDMSAMMEPEKMKAITEKYSDFKPGFSFIINCSDYTKAKKALEKGKFSLDDVSPVSISISKPGETDYSKVYSIVKMNMSLEDAFKELEKAINQKGDSYFVSEMEVDNGLYGEFDPDFVDKVMKENSSIENYPVEDDLKNNELLVIVYGKENSFFYNSSLKQLEKYYPYKYKVVTHDKFTTEVDKGYKYVLMAKGDVFKKKSTSFDEMKISVVRGFYYVFKDLASLNMYYGPEKEKLILNQSESPSKALKTALQMMQKHYNWKEKE